MVVLRSGMFLVVSPEGFLRVCKVICREVSPAACPVEWEEGCQEDQAGPAPNNFHQTPVQGLALCKGFRINRTPLTRVIRQFNHLDNRVSPHRLGWDTQVRRRHSPCWLSRTDRWKLSKGETLKRGNREREVA